MNVHQRLSWLILPVLAGAMVLTGCTEIRPGTSEAGTYATQNRESTIEYAIYGNKQITIFINQITSRMGVIQNSDQAKAENEQEMTRMSIDLCKQAMDEFIIVNPSTGAEELREQTILAMDTAIQHLENYAEALKNGENTEDYKEIFENDYYTLTGLSSLYVN